MGFPQSLRPRHNDDSKIWIDMLFEERQPEAAPMKVVEVRD